MDPDPGKNGDHAIFVIDLQHDSKRLNIRNLGNRFATMQRRFLKNFRYFAYERSVKEKANLFLYFHKCKIFVVGDSKTNYFLILDLCNVTYEK
jgi:hypothetical protein